MASKIFEDDQYRNLCSEKTLQSNSQGFFMNFVEHLLNHVGPEWVKTVFGKLSTDQDRIKCVYESNKTKTLLQDFLINVQEVYRQKNASISQKKRLEAELLMEKQDYQGALLLFCQSIIRSAKTGQEKSFDSGVSLSLALWGRSEALLKLGSYSNAIVDVQQALKENLPGSYKAQAFWRMAKCYAALGEESRSKVSFDLTEKLLEGNQEKIEQLNADRLHYQHHSTVTQVITDKGDADQKQLYASNKLTVKMSKSMGRYIVANERIEPDETLLVESPYAACLLPEFFGSHCHHCFTSLKSPFGCPDCASVAFCSLDCKDQAIATYHKHECKYLDLLIGSGMSVLAHTSLRMITQFGLQRCLEIYRNKSKEKIYRLCTNSHLRSPEDFFQRTLMASFLLRCLRKANFFQTGGDNQVSPSRAEYEIGEMLLFNLQVLQFNAHEVYETRYTDNCKPITSRVVFIGVAIYLTASLFNHDCHPALSRHFVGKSIVLTSVRPLNPNEIIPENYGPVFTRQTLAERKRSLSSRYWFDCQCMACQQNWPPIGRGLENVSERLMCPTPGCTQILTLPVPKANNTHCLKCRSVIDVPEKVLHLKRCLEQYRIASDMMKNLQTKEAKEMFCQAINTFYKQVFECYLLGKCSKL
uniref:Protein-lysine N-methyltransferase SMYD4 n=1 Tax=Dendroctonus ponderosae TaxID=77166 RepID=A0AAR5QBJ1_DENPD